MMGCSALFLLLFSGWWLTRRRSLAVRRAGLIGAFVILCGLITLIRLIGIDGGQNAGVALRQTQTADDWAERSQSRLKDQAVRLIDTVYWSCSGGGMLDYCGDPSNIKIRWDRGRNAYTYLDGSTLRDPLDYRQHTWRPFPNHNLGFIVERNTASLISASVVDCDCNGPDPDVPSMTLRVFNVKSRDKSIFVFRPGSDARNTLVGWGQGAKLKEGEEIQAEATLGDKKQLSPVFKP
jgi:hypothetical protein